LAVFVPDLGLRKAIFFTRAIIITLGIK
jgi:hypothetical protein